MNHAAAAAVSAHVAWRNVAATLRLMWRLLRRDWRAGELTVLGLALTIAVASLTSVGFLTDRVGQALVLESHQLLGGDLLLSADHPLPDSIRHEAEQRGLQHADTLGFPSMVRSAGGQQLAQLADVKAVTPGYPLRGTLRIASTLNAPVTESRETREIPARGTVWLDERLCAALDVKPGDAINLGSSHLTVAAILTQEPDRGINMFGFAPRLLLHYDDIAATGLVRPASRVSYRLQLAGEPRQIEALGQWLKIKGRLERGERLEDMSNARPEMRAILERAQRFLRLAALLAVVLAAVAVGFAADRYMRRHLDGCAVMRCLGASQAQLLIIHGGEFFLFGLLATLAGCLLGYVTQLGLQALLGGLLLAELPAPSLLPWVHGLLVGLLLVAGFAAPPLLRLRAVPTLRVLRREFSGKSGGRDAQALTLASYGLGLLALMGLMLWIAGEIKLGAIVIGGFTAALGLYALLARLLLQLVGALGQRLSANGRLPGLRLGLASLRRHSAASVLQATSLGLGLTALLLLTVARQDLLTSWQSRMPADAPNRFVINIQPEQRQPLQDFFVAQGLPAPRLEPMIRARLVAINDTPITATSYADERAQHLADREFNLSWMAAMPVGNRITEGRWHGDGSALKDGSTEFSVEQGLAKTLNLQLGDRLAYDIAGQRLTGSITSLRQLNWDSMRVNFFVITPPGVLEQFPGSDITSFYLPTERGSFVNTLVRKFPNLTVIDVAALVRQLQTTLDQIARAVQLIFAFALLTGLMVLYAALQASQDERRYELALLRALGARSRQMRAALLSEFDLLGGVAGLLAGIGATAISLGLARFALQLEYQPSISLLLTGLIVGAAGIALAGWLGTAGTLRRPALASLRGEA